MKKKKEFPKLTPEIIVEDNPALFLHLRTNISPPLTNFQIERAKYGIFLGHKFLQDNGFTTRMLVLVPNDVESLILRVKDFTENGLYFYRTSYRNYIKALDRGTDPEKACKNILERDLRKFRAK